MMKNWRDVNTSIRVSVLARQVMKSVNEDTTKLSQSQRDMLAAVAVRIRGLSIHQAMYEFGTAESSIGFARTILRLCAPQVAGLVLSGLASVHAVNRLRRKMGDKALLAHLLSMSDNEITAKYTRKTTSSTPKVETITTAATGNHQHHDLPLTVTQIRAQNAANARWTKYNANQVLGLPVVADPGESEPIDMKPIEPEWTSKSINRAYTVMGAARELLTSGDLEGANQILRGIGVTRTEI